MGIRRSRATVEKSEECKSLPLSTNEVDQPPLKKLRRPIENSVGDRDDEDFESGSEDEEQSESGSSEEKSIAQGEKNKSSEFESDGDSQIRNKQAQQNMDLGENTGTNEHDQSNVEEDDGSSESEEVEEDEDDSAESVAKNDKANMEFIEKHSNNNLKQNVDVNEEEEEDSSESEENEEEDDGSADLVPGGDSEANSGHENMDLGEKFSSDALKQIVVANGHDSHEDDGSYESETEASQDHDLGGDIARGKSRGVFQSRGSLAVSTLRNEDVNTPQQINFPRKSKTEKSPYARWSDSHVLTLLECLIKVKNEDKEGSKYHIHSVHQAIGDLADFKPSLPQVKEKIRRLKNMHARVAKKSREYLSSHEAQVLKLCDMLWGKEIKENIVDKSGGGLILDDCFEAKNLISQGFHLLEGSKRQEDFEKEWNKSRLKEIELYLKRLDIVRKHLKAVKYELRASLRSQEEVD
ncbi:OLC1v1018598C2 [Oldenlandia corymbosa var. corymbosa]|nr:OLC1v1018598C2 [Oldenlandia corymbosa var. corymbosa]